METEFGVTPVGTINCEEGFTQPMEALLPKDRVIKVNKFLTWIEEDDHGFNMSNDMIDFVPSLKFSIYGEKLINYECQKNES